MSRFDWSRVRAEQKVRNNGAEPIEGSDRTLTTLGHLSVNTTKQQAAVDLPGGRAGNIRRQPYVARAIAKMLGKEPTPRWRPPVIRKSEPLDEARQAIVQAELEKVRIKKELKATREARQFVRLQPRKSKKVAKSRAANTPAEMSPNGADVPRNYIEQKLGKRTRKVVLERKQEFSVVGTRCRQKSSRTAS